MSGNKTCTFRADDIKNSAGIPQEPTSTRSMWSRAEDQPFEQCPDGLIKHLVHEKMGTREHCVDAYMLFIEGGGRTGKHRHMWEEVVFVAEGSGYDLHWDLKFDCIDAYQWDWESEPRKFEWTARRFHLHPALLDPSAFQHRAKTKRVLIVISNRIVKAMGFDWLDQVENAPGA